MPHTPLSRNRVVGNGDVVELRKIEQEISFSRSSMFFENETVLILLSSIFVVVGVYVIGIYA